MSRSERRRFDAKDAARRRSARAARAREGAAPRAAAPRPDARRTRRALDVLMLKSLTPAAVGLCLLFAVFAVSHALLLPPAAARTMSAVAGSTSAVMLALALALRRARIPAGRAHVLGAAIAALTLANGLLHIYLVADPQHTSNLALIVIGAGAVFLSTRWLALVLAAALAGWGVCLWLVGDWPRWYHFGFVLVSSAVLSALIHGVRVRTLARLERLHAEDVRLREELDRALRASRASEERYRQLFENASDIIYRTDARGHFVFVNPIAVRLLKYSADELAGLHYLGLIRPDYRAAVEEHYVRQYTERLASTYLEFPAVAKDGTELWLGQNVELVLEGNHVVGFQAVVRDVTDRKRAEDELTVAKERLERLLASSPAVLYSCAASGGYPRRYISENVVSLLGFEAAEVVVQPGLWLERVHPQDRPRLEAATAALADRGHLTTEYRFRRRDERYLWLRDDMKLLRDGDGTPFEVVGCCVDITEEKRAEAAMREAEDYRNLFQLANDPIIVFDPDGEIVLDVNEKACEVYGFARDVFVGKSLREISEDPERGERELAMLLAEGDRRGPYHEFETVQRRADGAALNLIVHSSVIDYQGRRAVLSINRDVTAYRHAERALRESEDRLRQAQKMEAIGRLAGGVAHDFNNLLTVIGGYSDILMLALEPQSRLRTDAEQIKRAAERAAALTRQLLAFGRKQVLRPRVLDLNEVVADMDKMLRRLIGEDVELLTVLDPALGRVTVDPGQIEQVIVNLAVNARDAMPDGGNLTVETRNVWLDDTTAQAHASVAPGPHVLLSVSDTGLGMTDEVRARVFEPFFTTKPVGEGTGLGLSTVYGIVEQSGGAIEVESAPGKGTRFRVYLPRVETTSEAASREAERPAVPRGSETVLVVEDEDGVRRLACAVLSGAGYRVLEARSGAAALNLLPLEAEPVQLVLTDVVMPGMSGRELADRVKAVCPQVRVLYMSGYSEDAVAKHGVLDAEAGLLEKPFSPDALARKVREALDGPRRGARS